MKIKFFLSIVFITFYFLPVKAWIYKDKTMIDNKVTYNLNYCLPGDYDSKKAYPLIVAMHYCGGTAKEYRNALAKLSDSLKMIVVCPDNNSNVIQESAEHMLVTAIDSSTVFYNIDTTQVYLTGMSCNGEYITRHGLKNFYPFKGIFPWDPWITFLSPTHYNFDCKIPVVISVGSDDDNYKTLVALYDSLKKHQATVNLLIVPGVGHSLYNGIYTEMINCIYYINGSPDFSFQPIADFELANSDSSILDVVVNNPGNKRLKYSAYASSKMIITKTEIIPGDNENQFKIKLIPNKKTKGKVIITIKAFDEATNDLAQGLVRLEVKSSTASSEQINQSGFKVYPVPVNDYLFFESNEPYLSMKIFDISGKEMMSFKNVEASKGINLQSLTSGFYFLVANETERVKFYKR
jgi:hypothetical protein